MLLNSFVRLRRLKYGLWLVFLALCAGAPALYAQVSTNYNSTNYIRFESATYFANEDSIQARIGVVREGPLTNFVTVQYTMSDGTAFTGVHYFRQSGTLFFFPGVDRVEFVVPLIDNFNANGNVFLNLALLNPGSISDTLALLGTPDTATLTIIDDESAPVTTAAGIVEIAPGNGFGRYHATLEEWNTNEPGEANFTPYGPGGVQVTIVRKGGTRGRIHVDWRTTTNIAPLFTEISFTNFFGIVERSGGLAIPFEHFLPTNGTTVLDDFQMSTNVLIRLPQVFQPEPWAGFETNFLFGRPFTLGVELTAVRAAPEEAGQDVNPALGSVVRQPVTLVPPSFGFCFTRIHYTVNEGQRYARVRVRRSLDNNGLLGPVHVHYVVNPRLIATDAQGGDHQGNLFPLEPASEYSHPFIDYEPPGSAIWTATVRTNDLTGNGWVQQDNQAIINWGQDEVTDRFMLIPLIDDKEAEFNEDMRVYLWKHDGETDGFPSFYAGICNIKILDNDQPAGASEVGFNPDNNALTDPPYMTTPGANNTVQSVAVQPDGKVILGGDFSKVNTADRNGIARLNFDGSIDHTFQPGLGASGFVRAVATDPIGNILLAGGFDSVNGTPRFGIARLLTNGVVDATFNPGRGVDGPIRAMTLQSDGKILIGGEFLSFDGTNRAYIARLHPNGKLDTSFDPGFGPNGPVNSIAVSAGALDIDHSSSGGPAEERFLVDTGSTQGNVTINYDFINIPDQLRIYYDGQLIYDTGVVNGVGTINVPYGPGNSTFIEIVMNEGSGLDGTIWFYDLLIEPLVDSRPVIGGEFTDYNGTRINYIARLNLDGSIDPSFNPGTGADGAVNAVAKFGNKVIMAGDFKTVDLRSRRGVARLNVDGSLDATFDPGSGFDNTVYTVAMAPNGKPLLGGTFFSFNSTRRIGLARLNVDGTLDTSFMDTAKNQFAGVPNPLSPENIQSLENYIRSMAAYRLTNMSFTTNQVVSTNGITNDVITTNIAMTDHLFVGGRFSRFGGGFRRDDNRTRLNVARLNAGATPGPGNISFAKDFYSVDENAGRTFITLIRTNGSLAPISARFDATSPALGGPGVAQAGNDYVATNYFPLWVRSHDGDRMWSDAFMGPNNNAFSTNRPRGDFTIYPPFARPAFRYSNFDEDNIFLTILDDNVIEGDEVLSLTLSTPDMGRLLLGGEPIPIGTALGKTRASLIIADNDFNFGTLGFSDREYIVDENGTNAVITVTRVGGSSGTVTVDVSTRNDTAGSTDFDAITKRTLTFANGQLTNRFNIRIRDDTIAEFEETVLLLLTNATGFPTNVAPDLRLDPARSTAVLTIMDNDFDPGRISFENATYTVLENEAFATVTLKRTGGNVGDIQVNYMTSDGSAVAGQDYTAVSGVLQWVDKDTAIKSFTIPIHNNLVVDSDKTINLSIFNPIVKGAFNTNALGIRPTATVKIVNDDAFGALRFTQPSYSVDENGAFADITVIRVGGVAGTVTVDIAATNLTAVGTTNFANTAPSVPDFVLTNATLTFGPDETAKSIRVYILDDAIVEGDKTISLTLSRPGQGTLGAPSTSILTIVDNELSNIPAGSLDTSFEALGTDDFIYSIALQNDNKILLGGDFHFINNIVRNRLARLNTDGTLDTTFDPAVGPNGSVRSLSIQSDTRIIAGGLFTSISNTNRNYITRLNVDSNVDPTFNPGAGTDNPIYATLVQPDGNILLVGEFSTYRGIERKGIVRVTTNGVMDATFNPGTGANGTIFAVALQADGKILIGGDFTTFNQVPRSRIARLNKNGSLDLAFGVESGTSNILSGADRSVRTVVVQPDQSILIGGLFSNVNGAARRGIARLLPSGAIDTSFNPGQGATSPDGSVAPVNTIALQLDGKILVGGDFTRFNGVTRNRITRLNLDGSNDPTINFGTGANGTVNAIVVQPDRNILLVGGFTSYNDVPVQRLARIHGGALSGPGSLEFSRPFFLVNENAPTTNATITVRRTGGTTGEVAIDFVTLTNGTATVGLDYTAVNGKLTFPEGETFQSFVVPIVNDDLPESDESVSFSLRNPTGGARLGAQPNATLIIESDDSRIGFTAATYSITENVNSGVASVTVTRSGSVGQQVQVDFRTVNGTATAGRDFTGITNTLVFRPGETSKTFAISIQDDTLVEGNETVLLQLTNIVSSGGIVVFEPGFASSVLVIVDNDFSPGVLSFEQTSYDVDEPELQGATTNATIRVRRDVGSTGTVQVEYEAIEGSATHELDFIKTSGRLTFADGETNKAFNVLIRGDDVVEGNETILIRLFNISGGATFNGPTNIVLTIIDSDRGPGSLDETFNPGSGANIPIVRTVKIDAEGKILLGGDFTAFAGQSNQVRVARLLPEGTVDPNFSLGSVATSGPDARVSTLDIQADGRIVIGGLFNAINNNVNSRRVGRLMPSGGLDTSFSLPLGLDAEVSELVVQPDGKILIGGSYVIASAAGRRGIARLNTSGTLDIAFNPGQGANQEVNAVELMSDGKVVIGGAFTIVNNEPRSGVARLNANGSVDSMFNVGAGANGTVYAVEVDASRKVYIGGDFTAYNGVTRSRIARINADGSLDQTFTNSFGVNGRVNDIYLQSDGKVLIAGDFSSVEGVSRFRIARLNANGSLDPTFDAGAGPNGPIHSIDLDLNGRVVVAGDFTEFNGKPRSGVARLNNDSKFRVSDIRIMVNSIRRLSNGNVEFSFTSEPGRMYVIEATTNLGQWSTLATVPAGSTTTQFVDTSAASLPYRFYRVRRQ